MKAFLQTADEVAKYYGTHSRDTRNASAAFREALGVLLEENGRTTIRALVVGCGNGQHDVTPLCEAFISARKPGQMQSLEITAVDSSADMIAALNARLDPKVNRTNQITITSECRNVDLDENFLDGREFDLAVMFAVLQHTINWRYIVTKVLGAMSVGGFLFADEWFSDPKESPLAVLDIPDSARVPDWPYFFALRERYTGAFWDPEIKAHDACALVRFLSAYCHWRKKYDEPCSGEATGKSISIIDAVKDGRGFGPLAWGRGVAYAEFIKQKTPDGLSLSLAVRSFGFKVFAFRTAEEIRTPDGKLWSPDDALAVSMPVFEARMLKRFCVEVRGLNRTSDEDETARIRQVQVLQLGLQYCCFSPQTLFAFPIQAEINMESATSHSTTTAPVRSMLVPDGAAGTDALVRLVANLFVLRGGSLPEQHQSVTAALLNVFDVNPTLLPCSFRLSLGSGSAPEIDEPRLVNGVTIVDVRLPKAPSLNQDDLRNTIRSKLTAGSCQTHRFQTLRAIDLDALTMGIDAADEIISKATPVAGQVNAYKESLKYSGLGGYEAVARLFAVLSPMLADNERLVLVFSPCQFAVDESSRAIKRTSLGAIAVLEKTLNESDSMTAFRIARLELLNRALQTERYNAMHRVGEGLRQQLIKSLRQIRVAATEISEDARFAAEPLASISEQERILALLRYIDLRLEAVNPSEPKAPISPDLVDAMAAALIEKPLSKLLKGQSLRHLFLDYGGCCDAKEAIASKVNSLVFGRIARLQRRDDFRSHCGGLKDLCEVATFTVGTRPAVWWPLLSDPDIPDYWKEYCKNHLYANTVTLEIDGSGPKLLPFLVYIAQALFSNSGDARCDRKPPSDIRLSLQASETESILTAEWSTGGTIAAATLQGKDSEHRGPEKLCGRLWFMSNLFYRSSCTIAPKAGQEGATVVVATILVGHNSVV